MCSVLLVSQVNFTRRLLGCICTFSALHGMIMARGS